MFKIHINDGTQPLPEDDVYYVVAKEGIFLKKRMGVMESLAPVKNISILQSIQAAAKMHIKKIPGGQFARVVAFFREVYKEYHGESIVLLFYDETKRVYKIVPPHQKVTAAACDYNKGITIEGMTMIGTIHSHASMSAFHSGTDDKDEEHFDGLHITIGNVNDEDVSITSSIVANGHRFVVEPDEYVERLVKTVDIDETETRPTRKVFVWKDGKMVEDTVQSSKYTYSFRKMDKRYKVDVSDRYHKVIPEWMEMVERGTYHWAQGYGYGYGYGGYGTCGHTGSGFGTPQIPGGGNRKWGQRYDRQAWRDVGRLPGGQKSDTDKSSIYNVGVKVKPITFPEHEVEIPEDEHVPCLTCVFRGHKFLMEEEGIDDEPEVFHCKKCDCLVIDEVCPLCESDEHLVAIDDDQLPDNFTEEDLEPIKTDGIKQHSDFIQCPVCFGHFYTFDGQEKCPFCYAKLSEFELNGTEEQIEEQMRADSGEFMDDETEEIRKAALEAAKEADEEFERIPDPNEPSIPMGSKRTETKGFFNFFFRGKKK
jgi:PRTRC genetic system protein A